MSLTFVTSLPVPVCEYRYRVVKTAWGPVVFVCRGELVSRLILSFSSPLAAEEIIRRHYPTARQDDSLLENLHQDLVDYFRGQVVEFNCTVDLSWAGDFSRSVLHGCCQIQPGCTLSYSQLACRIGRPKTARAVGNVMARNRIPLIIPCHRVVTARGTSGGYSAEGGGALKKRLLEHESAIKVALKSI